MSSLGLLYFSFPSALSYSRVHKIPAFQPRAIPQLSCQLDPSPLRPVNYLSSATKNLCLLPSHRFISERCSAPWSYSRLWAIRIQTPRYIIHFSRDVEQTHSWPLHFSGFLSCTCSLLNRTGKDEKKQNKTLWWCISASYWWKPLCYANAIQHQPKSSWKQYFSVRAHSTVYGLANLWEGRKARVKIVSDTLINWK